MIKACILFDENDEPFGFRIGGHAGFEASGRDIICAAVSILAYTFLESVSELTNEPFVSEVDEAHGLIRFRFKEKPLHEGRLLFQALLEGLRMINEEYGEEFLHVRKYRRSSGTFTKINDQEV